MKKSTVNTLMLGKLTQLAGLMVLSLSALSLSACEPSFDEIDANVATPSDQAAVPDAAEVGGEDAIGDVSELIGETVTVSTKITEVLSPNLFTLYDIESLRGEEMLAITNFPIPEQGANIEVTGEVMELDEAAIQQAYNVTLEPDMLEAYAGRPYLAVTALELVD